MKYLLLFLILCVCVYITPAAEDEPRYAGGMMVSGGSISLENGFADMSGLYAGVGGRLFFIFGPGFRLGTFGG
ncbi:MAG: hypothetical protein ACQEQ4_11190 [Fibrobacterota bacterium]